MAERCYITDMDLRDLRKRAGFSQAGLSDVSGVRVATICEIETGKIRSPHYRTLVKLASAMDVTVAQVAAAVGHSGAAR